MWHISVEVVRVLLELAQHLANFATRLRHLGTHAGRLLLQRNNNLAYFIFTIRKLRQINLDL